MASNAQSASKSSGKKATGLTAAVVAIIAATIALEGGYVHHPADPGGETNRGITKAVAVADGYTGPMRTLPVEVAQSIYYKRYLVEPGFAPLVEIDAPVAQELFDTAVNMGPARPSRFFQESINTLCRTRVAVDGRVGPATIAAYTGCQSTIGATGFCRSMLDALDSRQRTEYDRLILRNPALKAFRKGWFAHRIGNVDRANCTARAA